MIAPIRVCFVSQLAYRLFDPECPMPFGGAELQMHTLARELAKDEAFDVHFVTQDFGQPRLQSLDGITVWRYTRPFKGSRVLLPFRWLTVALSTLGTLMAVRPDIYVESPAGFATGVTALAARLRRTRFLYRIACDGDMDGSIVSLVVERRAYLWGLRRAHAIITRSRWQTTALETTGPIVMHVANAFPVPDSPPTTKKDSVLWVASAQNLKQPWVFLDLARAYPDERFVMVMPTNDAALFERIREQAHALPNVDFSGGVPFEEIQPYFDRAKVFVNTSTIEGFPNTFVQAAMGATPVLSLNISPDEVLTEHGFGRVAGGDEERLRTDLGELLADDAVRERMGAAGFDYAKAHHDIEVIIEQFKGLLRRILEARR